MSADLTYLLECVEAQADKFPVPEHIRSLVNRVRIAFASTVSGESLPWPRRRKAMSADIGWEEYQQICDKLSRANARVSELEDADRSLRSRLAEATATIERLTRERDEAKSLVARLNDVHSDVTSKARLAVIRAEALSTELAKAQQERDEARASLERMQEAMKDLADECDKISDALNEQTARAIVLGARALEKARRP